MPITQRYLVVKEKDSKELKYFEYDKLSGYGIKPNAKIRDAIQVNKMILINPGMVQKLITKKINKKFSRLLKLLTIVYENEDDETGEGYREALNEISKLRLEAHNKYRMYMEKTEFDILEKKLNILETEVKERLEMIYQEYENNYGGKSR